MKGLFAVIALVILGVLAFAMTVTRIEDGFNAVKTQAEIEQLQEDAKLIDVSSNEDVMGQITELNRRVKSRKAMRGTGIGWMYSSRWDGMATIQITPAKHTPAKEQP